MPIYEFRCHACQRKVSFFQRSVAASLSPTCPACGSSDLNRRISSFAFHKSERTRLEEVGEPIMFPTNPDYYKDPRNIGRSTEKRLKALGVDMESEEYKDTFTGVRETIAAARESELPQPLKDL